MRIRWVDAGRVSALRSQGIYHGLAYAAKLDTPNTVVVVIPSSAYICIGYFQNAGQEIDLAFCRNHNIPVIRRETGGGSVFIDDGQIFVQWVFQPGKLPARIDQRFSLFTAPLIETYQFFGINAYHQPVNDVHVGGKKIVGTGAATIGNADVVTGNFLLDFDMETMAKAFNLPEGNFRVYVKEALRNYMTTMKSELGFLPEAEEVKRVYKKKLSQRLNVSLEEGSFTDEELLSMERAEGKMSDEHWLHASLPTDQECRVVKIHAHVWIGECSMKLEGRTLKTLLQMNNHVIERVLFDAQGLFSGLDLRRMEGFLKGTRLEERELISGFTSFYSSCGQALNMADMELGIATCMRIKKEQMKKSGNA